MLHWRGSLWWAVPFISLSVLILLVRPTIPGIVVVLFFRCMGALLDPVNRTSRGTNWALVAHTVAMFSFLTIPIPMVLHKLSNWYINNRNFPGDDEDPPGPFGYSGFVDPKPIKVAYALMFPLNQWLADGLLVCFI